MTTFSPVLGECEREKKWKGWKRAVERSRKWREEDEEDAFEQTLEEREGLTPTPPASAGATTPSGAKVNGRQ